MSDQSIDKIKAIFCEIIGISETDVDDSTSYNSCVAWDSLKHLQMVSELEDEFGIEFQMDDIIAMVNFAKVKEIVLEYISK